MKNIHYIVWSENNNLGIPIIDEQHRGLISTINSLYNAIQRGQGKDKISITVNALSEYTATHFKTEEALFKEANYPALDEHTALHRELSAKNKRISLEASKNKDADMVLQFLKEWWLNHINKEDRKYTPYVIKVI